MRRSSPRLFAAGIIFFGTLAGGANAKPISLPVEVMGPEGSTRIVTFDIAGTGTQAAKLWLRVHKADYPNKIAVRINDAAWIGLNQRTTKIPGLGGAYGGFGGGFNILDMVVNLPADVVKPGTNTIRFRFHIANDETTGFRILKFNFLDPAGQPLLPPGAFADDNPRNWTGPFVDENSIAEGKRLWESAPLTTLKTRAPMRARCADCHAHDGRDLKYFNESNYAIRASAIGHGLTARDADLIASYIRSLKTPNPGRPWNPPYQPGPGLDSKPVSAWSAGAGLQSVLERDSQLLQSIPDSAYAPEASLNVRETAIPIQLPDWSRWLPRIHPLDAWGDEFQASEFRDYYSRIRAMLRKGDSVSYLAARELLEMWYVRWTDLMWPKILPGRAPGWSYEYTQKVESTALWKMVKLWEMMQEFELEGLAKDAFGPQAENRAWYTKWPFMVSPNMQHIPRGAPGISNGSVNTHIYISYAWYHLQLILNGGNKKQIGTSPIDWPYVYGFIKDMSNHISAPQAGLQTMWLIKAGQTSDNGRGPEFGEAGWMPNINDPSRLVHPAWVGIWSETDPEVRTATMQRILTNWFETIRSFHPEQFYRGGWTTAETVPVTNAMDGNMCDRIWYMLPQFQYYGVSPALTSSIASWAKTMWPRARWDTLPRSACTQLPTGEVKCVTPEN